MRIRFYGPLIIWGIAIASVPVWLLSYPETTLRHQLKPVHIYGSQIAATIGFALFALSFVLTVRMPVLERLFGGLDRVYHFHHSIARYAAVLLLIHPVLLATRWIPTETERLVWYLFPMHRRLEVNLGSWALWILLILLLFTLVIKIPYDKWKISHKFMGVAFILGVWHVHAMGLYGAGSPALAFYFSVLSVVGIAAWTYKTLLFDWLVHKDSYVVERVRRLNESVIEIELRPEDARLDFAPGQFFFFSFRSDGLSREAHPFTVCQRSESGHITIMVKSLGDYTRGLHERLAPGTPALLEGPYGRFDYRTGGNDQVWIGGGVGVAPFLSWANTLSEAPRKDFRVDMYYAVNTAREATHTQVFTELAKNIPSFRFHLIRADEEGFVDASRIPGLADRDIYICGPKPMRRALIPALRKYGAPAARVHYEDFEFT